MKIFTGTGCGPEKAYWKPLRTCKFRRIFPASKEGWTQDKIDLKVKTSGAWT
jgi:hypothetical protein